MWTTISFLWQLSCLWQLDSAFAFVSFMDKGPHSITRSQPLRQRIQFERIALQVIADFDMTLTKFKLSDGSRGMSTHCILESDHFGQESCSRNGAHKQHRRLIHSTHGAHARMSQHTSQCSLTEQPRMRKQTSGPSNIKCSTQEEAQAFDSLPSSVAQASLLVRLPFSHASSHAPPR